MNWSAGTWELAATAHALAIAASLLTYVLTTRAAKYRRPPSIAIAWVLGLIALPYAGLPLYLLFGRRKLRRRAVPIAAPGVPAAHWAPALIESFGLPGPAAARITMHADGAAARAALFETMASAATRLDLCTFLIGRDEVGRDVAARLIERARSGVRVRLLIDGVGALSLQRGTLAHLAAAGVETAVFCPLFARRTSGPRNLRNHRKMVIADARRLWAGGRNLAAEYFDGARQAPPWRDLSFDLRGAVAAAAARQFETDWTASGGRAESGGANRSVAPAPVLAAAADSTSLAQFLPSGPDQSEDTVHALLIDACFRAEERVLAVSPYFVPDQALEAAIRLAARRGVAVDICVPARSNHRLADFARSRPMRALADVGVRFHLLPGMVHAKAVVFDRAFALCGSVNLDSRSLLLNYESAFVLYGGAEIDWLAAWIGALIPQAGRFDRRPPGLWRDLGEGLLLSMAYQL
ncbi:MAG: PLDc N-terminal domain-containing protein [Gammaproteobacteria bacterium]|nr:PLDc N-terminal domain-containing protein [Gammaproteobacteria bacterium]